jgi:protein-S-isoprenylcysteine O-methyltransferase Ste14
MAAPEAFFRNDRMSNLAVKSIRGFLQLIAFLGVLLFTPAWTIHYWEAWVYLAVFAAASAFITAYLWKHDPKLLERRVHAGPAAEKESSQKWIQALAALAFFGELVLPSLDHRFGWSHVPFLLTVAADILILLGFFFVLLVFKENTFTSATIQVDSDQRVVSKGPYAIVRHPMYSGALLILFATPIALGSCWGLLMVVPMVLVLVFRILDEEKFLRHALPGYTDYCRSVKFRLAPLIW